MSDGKKHSVVSPSSAYRWMACPPSALLVESLDKGESSSFAEEGSLAHHIAELWLQNMLHVRDTKNRLESAVVALEEAKKHPLFYDGMIKEVLDYCQYVFHLLDMSGGGANMWVEAKYPLFYKTDDMGTVDNVVYSARDRTLYITDLKFGKGVQVDAVNNKQLIIYAISAYHALRDEYDIDAVVVAIVQPRRGYKGLQTLSIEDLEMWGDIIGSAASKALKGTGELKAGGHCMFCLAKPRCRAIKQLAADAADAARKAEDNPALLTNSEIATLLGSVDLVASWCTAIKKYALEQAVSGAKYEGYKVVAGTAKRKIDDEKAIHRALVAAGYEGSLFKRSSFVTIGELEKVIVKEDFATCCAPFISKPDGSPMLVPSADPRQEYGVAKAVQDFQEYMK